MTNGGYPPQNPYIPEIANVLPKRHSDQRAAAIGLVVGVVAALASVVSLRFAFDFLEGTTNWSLGSRGGLRVQAQLAVAYLPVSLLSGFLLHTLLARVDPVREGLWGASARLAAAAFIGFVAYLYPGDVSDEFVPLWLLTTVIVPGLLIGATRSPLGLAVFPLLFLISRAFSVFLLQRGLSVRELTVFLPVTGILFTVASALVLNRLDPSPFTYRDDRLMSATSAPLAPWR